VGEDIGRGGFPFVGVLPRGKKPGCNNTRQQKTPIIDKDILYRGGKGEDGPTCGRGLDSSIIKGGPHIRGVVPKKDGLDGAIEKKGNHEDQEKRPSGPRRKTVINHPKGTPKKPEVVLHQRSRIPKKKQKK